MKRPIGERRVFWKNPLASDPQPKRQARWTKIQIVRREPGPVESHPVKVRHE
ncbi:MAG: hypothetical protein L6Q95_18375 [Planctomycetes bacterium]|nr:hypothetical protein [Planctomycetota bacterium]